VTRCRIDSPGTTSRLRNVSTHLSRIAEGKPVVLEYVAPELAPLADVAAAFDYPRGVALW